ncbi:hypothetical protein G6F62_014952 [Rhizopus arrhizus]|nr:hypothetical protein G6F62_014952 [Rhizopus arrhizus]KAG1368990.1 hypothetical protein G6F60_015704 [Rhizopus arrhizus]
MAGSETSTDESTGVPVRCRMPATRNGLSAWVASVTAPVPWASTISSPRPTRCAAATSAPITASYRSSNGRPCAKASA